MASRRLPLVFIALIGVVASGYSTVGTRKDLDPKSNTDWLGVIAGDDAGSETELAAEMAKLFASQAPLRVAPVPGDSGLQNISRLLNDPHIDAGFVSTDVLAEAKAQGAVPNLVDRLQVVARFCPQEVHVLARDDIKSITDLAGKKVNFGPAGGSSAVTTTILFKALKIGIEPVALDSRAAIIELTQGAIAADVIVGAKPVPVIADIPSGKGLHLLPIDFGGNLEDAYLPTGFDHDD
ncbi:MAG: TAXI family TRAP transporter solute-binding subunit, partial [Methyloceanibacter sp.]